METSEIKAYPKCAVKRRNGLPAQEHFRETSHVQTVPPVISQIILDPEALAGAIHNATFLPCQLSMRPLPSRLTRVICPEVCLDLVSLGAAMLFTGTMPEKHYTLIFVTECERKGRSFNFAIEHNEGYMGFFPPGGVLDAYTPEGYANATLTVSAPVFESAVERLFPEIPECVLQHGAGIRIGATDQARLRRLLESVKEGIDDPSAPLAGEPVRCQLGIDLLEVFFSALRNGCESLIPPPGLRIAGKLRRLKQGRDFLTEHLHQPLSLDALCGELGMSRRGVEQLFYDSMGIGPNAFLRHQRLHSARRALQATPRTAGAVKQTALAWGFWHMGHFAREYRGLFGESPSATLARQRQKNPVARRS